MKSFTKFTLACAAIAAGTMFAGTARAGSVTFNGSTADLNGTGFGTVLSVLSVQDKDNPNSPGNLLEWGAQGPHSNGYVVDGITVDGNGLAGEASNSQGSNIRTVSNLFAIDANFIAHGDTLGLVFNVNQEGSLGSTTLNLHNFYVDFYKSDNTLLFSLKFDDADASNADTSALAPIAHNGTGTSGQLFQINMTATEYYAFFGTVATPNLNNFLGMHIRQSDSIGNANDGQDNFFLIAQNGPGFPPPIGAGPGTPLPSAAWGGMAMMAGVAGLGLWRKRRVATA